MEVPASSAVDNVYFLRWAIQLVESMSAGKYSLGIATAKAVAAHPQSVMAVHLILAENL